jgi:hypothetical protein
MKHALTLTAVLLGAIGAMTATTTGPAHAVVYCQYVSYPVGCVARPGVRLAARPIARAAVRPGTPMNRGGPVNRVGRR